MPVKVEVYIKNEEVPTQQVLIEGVKGHPCTLKETFIVEKVISEKDRLTLELVRKIAKQKGLKIEIYNVSSFKGKIMAIIKRVKTTPTVIIGDHKLEGVPTKEQILKLL